MSLLAALLYVGLSALSVTAHIPPHNETARVARFVAHHCDWGALATISSHEPVRAQPFANVFSVSDGPRGESSGVPYFYLTDIEISVQDLQVNANASLTMSLAQTPYCREKHYDPQSPLCAHIIFSGVMQKVEGKENDTAKIALFSRHPEMATWPRDHNWFFAKLNITNIWVLDYFGGIKTVTPDEYYKAKPCDPTNQQLRLLREVLSEANFTRDFLKQPQLLIGRVAAGTRTQRSRADPNFEESFSYSQVFL